MTLTPIRRYGVMIFMLLILAFSSEVLAKTYTATASQKSHLTKTSNKQVSSKQEYSRNSVKSSLLSGLRKYPSGTPRRKALLRTAMSYITSQNAAIITERNWLVSKQYQGRWLPAERVRLKDIAKHYEVKWSDNTREIPRNTLPERADITPTSMVATMAAAESGRGTLKLVCNNNNLFGTKCMKGCCTNVPGKVKGYPQFSPVREPVSAYVTNLNTHPAYSLFRKSRAQLRKADQEVIATAMIHKLKGYSTKGESYNNYLFVMYQGNRRSIVAYI